MKNFKRLNPFCCLLYFAAVIAFSMIFLHPFAVAMSAAASFFACLCVCPQQYKKSLPFTLFMSLMITLINPLFNHGGSTVLFYVFKKAFTFESLFYGLLLAGVFLSSISWFMVLSTVLDSDKFIYMFGNIAPGICVLISTTMRLIPLFSRRSQEVYDARSCIGKPIQSKYSNAVQTFSAVASDGLESSVGLGFSMKNRGFGAAKRSCFSVYSKRASDILFCIFTLLLSIVVIALGSGYFSAAPIVPEIIIVQPQKMQWTAVTAYGILLLLPLFLKISEELKWYFSASKI